MVQEIIITFPGDGGNHKTLTYLTCFQLKPLCVCFLNDFIYLFLERGEEKEKGEEKHLCVVASQVPPTGDLACNPGMCTDWESNWRPFSLQARAQFTEPHQPGLFCFVFTFYYTN